LRLFSRGAADMTEGNIRKHILDFAIPMAIGLLFQQFYNTVDAVVVGRFVSKQALAAVGSTGSIVNMLVGVCAGLSTGASVVISQYYGAHDFKKLQRAIPTTLFVTLFLCVFTTILGVSIVPGMLRFMDTPMDVFREAQSYLTIYFYGVGGLLIYNMGSAILRAVGDSIRPLMFLCFSAFLNILFDLIFVLYFYMGVEGVAYATILAEFLSAILVLISLSRGDAPYAIHWRHLCFDVSIFKRILSIGLPSSVQQGITSFSNVFVQSYINAFGSDCMAGWSGYNKIDVYLLVPVQSIALAATTFVGQNYGAGDLLRAKRGVKESLRMALCITLGLSILLILARRPLLMLFSTEESVLDYGSRFILLISPFYFFVCFNQIYASALRGVGKSRTPMFIMIGCFVVFRQIYLYTTKALGFGFVAVAMAYPIGWTLCSLLMSFFYAKSVIGRATEMKEARSTVL